MQNVRSLLVCGNSKLSQGVFRFDIPADRTYPGKSKLCSRHCYAKRNRYLYPQVQERLAWNFEQSKRNDFADRLVDELYRKGVLLMRWHCAGDVYSPAYARKMLDVIGRSSHTTFWFYTRSWRIAAIYPVLKAISVMPNVKAWFSADAETGFPPELPPSVKVAWMATDETEDTQNSDLVFLLPAIRRKAIPLATLSKVCPTELPDGKLNGTTCATCSVCWK